MLYASLMLPQILGSCVSQAVSSEAQAAPLRAAPRHDGYDGYCGTSWDEFNAPAGAQCVPCHTTDHAPCRGRGTHFDTCWSAEVVFCRKEVKCGDSRCPATVPEEKPTKDSQANAADVQDLVCDKTDPEASVPEKLVTKAPLTEALVTKAPISEALVFEQPLSDFKGFAGAVDYIERLFGGDEKINEKLFNNSPFIKWNDFTTFIKKWNKYYHKHRFMDEDNLYANLTTFAAFFGNAKHESSEFQACGEYVSSSLLKYKCSGDACSGAYAEDYRDNAKNAWGCSQIPKPDKKGGWSDLGKNLPKGADPCGQSTNEDLCRVFDIKRKLRGNPGAGNCWFGRGMIQLTWNCNYYKSQQLLAPLGFTGKKEMDLCKNPDRMCQRGGGELYLGSSISYWFLNTADKYQKDRSFATVCNSIKNGWGAISFAAAQAGGVHGWARRKKFYQYYIETLQIEDEHVDKLYEEWKQGGQAGGGDARLQTQQSQSYCETSWNQYSRGLAKCVKCTSKADCEGGKDCWAQAYCNKAHDLCGTSSCAWAEAEA